jgi:hypothetical protein
MWPWSPAISRLCLRASNRMNTTPPSVTPAEAGVQEGRGVTGLGTRILPAPDQVGGRLCAGVTRNSSLRGDYHSVRGFWKVCEKSAFSGWQPQGRRPWGWLNPDGRQIAVHRTSHPQAALEAATRSHTPSQGFSNRGRLGCMPLPALGKDRRRGLEIGRDENLRLEGL